MSEHGTPDTPEQIKNDIEATRAELAATVEELTARANVKKRAADKVHQLQDSARPYQPQIIAGSVGAIVVVTTVLVLRRRRASS